MGWCKWLEIVNEKKIVLCTSVNIANHYDPLLYFSNEPIQIVKETKIPWNNIWHQTYLMPHVKYLKVKFWKALNLLGVVAHTHWGADYTALMQIDTSCNRSKLDYGSIVNGSGRK